MPSSRRKKTDRSTELRPLVGPLGFLFLTSGAVGCVAPVGSKIKIPPDSATTCARHCQSIGMKLSAVAIMANNVGCICAPIEAKGKQVSESEATAGAVGGMIAPQAQEEQRSQQEQPEQTTSTVY